MRAATVILPVAIGLAMACDGPKPGEYCDDNWAQCLDDHTALWCDNGTFREFSCPGPEGCRLTAVGRQRVSSCDPNGMKPGDKCISMFAGFVLCTGGTTNLKCNGNKWVSVECPMTCVTGTTGIGTAESRGTCE